MKHQQKVLLSHAYIHRINNRLVFKITDWYRLELQTSGSLKLFGSIRKLIGTIKNGENVLSLEVF